MPSQTSETKAKSYLKERKKKPSLFPFKSLNVALKEATAVAIKFRNYSTSLFDIFTWRLMALKFILKKERDLVELRPAGRNNRRRRRFRFRVP